MMDMCNNIKMLPFQPCSVPTRCNLNCQGIHGSPRVFYSLPQNRPSAWQSASYLCQGGGTSQAGNGRLSSGNYPRPSLPFGLTSSPTSMCTSVEMAQPSVLPHSSKSPQHLSMSLTCPLIKMYKASNLCVTFLSCWNSNPSTQKSQLYYGWYHPESPRVLLNNGKAVGFGYKQTAGVTFLSPPVMADMTTCTSLLVVRIKSSAQARASLLIPPPLACKTQT